MTYQDTMYDMYLVALQGVEGQQVLLCYGNTPIDSVSLWVSYITSVSHPVYREAYRRAVARGLIKESTSTE